MKAYKISLFILICFVNLPGLFAQGTKPKPDSTMASENITIVKGYKPKLQDAKKIDIVPADEKLTVKKPEITYKTPASLFKTSPTKTKLVAPNIQGIKLPQLNRNYVKAGFGNYGTIYGEFFYNTLRNRTSISVRTSLAFMPSSLSAVRPH
jgi:hypothetical protein